MLSAANGGHLHTLSHSTAVMDVTHPFTTRKSGKKHREQAKIKMMSAVQTEVFFCFCPLAGFLFPANIFAKAKECREERGSAAKHSSAAGWRCRRGGSYPLIWGPPPSSPLSLLAFCRPCQEPPCDGLFSSPGSRLGFLTSPLGNQESIIKAGRSRKRHKT